MCNWRKNRTLANVVENITAKLSQKHDPYDDGRVTLVYWSKNT